MEQTTYGIRELANWILSYAQDRDVQLSNMSLNKLIYFAYESALLLHNRKLTNAKIEAWEHGPVFREVYRSFSEFGGQPISKRATKYNPATDRVEEVMPTISSSDALLIESIIEPLVRLSASVLRELSHAADSPWAATWYHTNCTNPGMQISDDMIRCSYSTRTIAQC